jgi:hypothetical protein
MSTMSTFVDDRTKVLKYLNSQLIGPVDGVDEEIEGSPLDRYLLGVLYPQSAEASEIENEEEGEASFSADDEADAENPISMAFERLPASVGISFFVTGSDTLQCDVRGGAYERKGTKKGEQWKRVPLFKGAAEVHLLHRPVKGVMSTREAALGGRAQVHAIWRPMGSGNLVTVTLLNSSVCEEGRPSPEHCLFQVGVTCRSVNGQISDYPRVPPLNHDPEEGDLALLYRKRRVFAVGHGSAAEWEETGKGREVRTNSMPTHEVFPVTTELSPESALREDRQADRVLSLEFLSDEAISSKSLRAELESFVDRYARWIERVRIDARGLSQHTKASQRILGRLETAASRMRRGVDSLKDDTVRDAFRLANRAMLMQMVHSGKDFGGTTRNRDERPFSGPPYSGAAVASFRWRPFQLAFLLLTLQSIADPTCDDRDLVDLIWFPTGGGKTEAYLLVAALEMFLRRLRKGPQGGGTAVIKRYTLRLLTSQQFQRAATLICACERLRANRKDLGSEEFSLGLWIGGGSTPNTFGDAVEQFEAMVIEDHPENPFQLQRCPWCGTRVIPELQSDDRAVYGVRATATMFEFFCPTTSCPFHSRLPVSVIDDDLYQHPPTMLIGTIDKFARLAWDHRPQTFFGGEERLPPGLIIQDELHLISGPLGTIAGIYEAAIDCLIMKNGGRPKYLAATATIRRSKDQAERLYARPVAVFPPSGIDADDSYFARTDRSGAGRIYVGAMGQGHTPVTSLVRAAAAASQAPVELADLSSSSRDGYWTLLIYHNSKRELGKTMALARDDIPSRIQVIATDPSRTREIDNVEELSANVPGRRIPEVLLQLERPQGEDAVDVLPCTNMISVGVDVKRLGVMMVIGQPKTTSEYIQASSRVGRDRVPGIVLTMYSPSKPRDRSHYESFVAYHDALYRWVEPSSVTPFALPARDRALHAALVIVARHVGGLPHNEDAQAFDASDANLKALIEWLGNRIARAEPAESAASRAHLSKLARAWSDRAARARAKNGAPLRYNGSGGHQFEALLCPFDSPVPGSWKTLNSMRHVDSEVRIHVNGEPKD